MENRTRVKAPVNICSRSSLCVTGDINTIPGETGPVDCLSERSGISRGTSTRPPTVLVMTDEPLSSQESSSSQPMETSSTPAVVLVSPLSECASSLVRFLLSRDDANSMGLADRKLLSGAKVIGEAARLVSVSCVKHRRSKGRLSAFEIIICLRCLIFHEGSICVRNH